MTDKDKHWNWALAGMGILFIMLAGNRAALEQFYVTDDYWGFHVPIAQLWEGNTTKQGLHAYAQNGGPYPPGFHWTMVFLKMNYGISYYEFGYWYTLLSGFLAFSAACYMLSGFMDRKKTVFGLGLMLSSTAFLDFTVRAMPNSLSIIMLMAAVGALKREKFMLTGVLCFMAMLIHGGYALWMSLALLGITMHRKTNGFENIREAAIPLWAPAILIIIDYISNAGTYLKYQASGMLQTKPGQRMARGEWLTIVFWTSPFIIGCMVYFMAEIWKHRDWTGWIIVSWIPAAVGFPDRAISLAVPFLSLVIAREVDLTEKTWQVALGLMELWSLGLNFVIIMALGNKGLAQI